MTKANCIIFIFIITVLFGGNNCLTISPQEPSSGNRRMTNAGLMWSCSCLCTQPSCPGGRRWRSPGVPWGTEAGDKVVEEVAPGQSSPASGR